MEICISHGDLLRTNFFHRAISSNPHLLTEIFKGFDKLDSENVAIRRDGRLVPMKKKRDYLDDDWKTRNSANEMEQPKREENEFVYDGTQRNISRIIDCHTANRGCDRSSSTVALSRSQEGSKESMGAHRNQSFPSADEIRSWRDLVDKQEYKPLTDIETLKSIKIPKVTKKRNDMVKGNINDGIEKLGGDIIRKRGRRSTLLKSFTDNKDSTESISCNKKVTTSNLVKIKSRKEEGSEEASSSTNVVKSISKFSGKGRFEKVIPDRLTPRVYVAFDRRNEDDVRGENKETNKDVESERKKRRLKEFPIEAKLGGEERRSPQKNGRDEVVRNVYERKLFNGPMEKFAVDENGKRKDRRQGFRNEEKMCGYKNMSSNDPFRILKVADAQNMEAKKAEKKRTNVVIKKLTELSSEDEDSEDEAEVRYEKSLVDNVIKSDRIESPEANCNNIAMKNLIKASPKHHIDNENYAKANSYQLNHQAAPSQMHRKRAWGIPWTSSSSSEFNLPTANASPMAKKERKVDSCRSENSETFGDDQLEANRLIKVD